MKLHLDSPATSSRRNRAARSNPVRLGTLALAVVFTASQMPAQPAPVATPLAATQQVADTNASTAPAIATSSEAVADVPSDVAKIESNALPEAPLATPTSDQTASVTMPPNVRAMMNDAAQQGQSLQSTQKSKGVQRPGMLIMGIAGLAPLALGTWIYAAHGSGAARAAFGSLFFVPGALMSGFGFTLAFKPKNN